MRPSRCPTLADVVQCGRNRASCAYWCCGRDAACDGRLSVARSGSRVRFYVVKLRVCLRAACVSSPPARVPRCQRSVYLSEVHVVVAVPACSHVTSVSSWLCVAPPRARCGAARGRGVSATGAAPTAADARTATLCVMQRGRGCARVRADLRQDAGGGRGCSSACALCPSRRSLRRLPRRCARCPLRDP